MRLRALAAGLLASAIGLRDVAFAWRAADLVWIRKSADRAG